METVSDVITIGKLSKKNWGGFKGEIFGSSF